MIFLRNNFRIHFQNVLKSNKSLISNNSDMIRISEILFSKILEFAKYKDYLKNSINYSQEIFYLNTLTLCLRLLKLILESQHQLLLTNTNIKQSLIRIIIELSFWDSYKIVDFPCQLFEILWNKSCFEDLSMRSDFQKIIEYIFLRRYQNYYDYN